MTAPVSTINPKKRSRCENCNSLYQPNPKRPKQRFCSENCRKEFHRYGSSYGPLKTGLHKAIDKKYAETRRIQQQQIECLRLEVTCFVREFKDLRVAVTELRVEVAELRAKMDADRGQFEKHRHNRDDGIGTTGPIVGGMFL